MTDDEKVSMSKLIKEAKENFSPVLAQEMYAHLAKEYRIKYNCFRMEGFTMLEALRLTVGYYE